MDITVIMPVYNAENTLKRTFDSLFNQTSDNWKVICVDDGSNDNSVDIIKSYQISCNRINLIQQSNAGPAVARARAISMAETEYVAILDADDEWASNYVETMLLAAQHTHADILVPDVAEFDDNGVRRERHFIRYKISPGMIIDDGNKGFEMAINWGLHGWYVLRTDFAKHYYTEDEVGYSKYNSDEFMVRLLYLKSKKTVLCDTIYYYRINPNSLTRTVSAKKVDSVITMSKITELAIQNRLSIKTIARLFLSAFGTVHAMLKYSNLFDNNDKVEAMQIIRDYHKKLCSMFHLKYLFAIGFIGALKLIFFTRNFNLIKIYSNLR